MVSQITSLLHNQGWKRAIAGVPLRRRRPRNFSEFVPLQETLAAAEAAGLSVGDYIDARHKDHATQDTIDGMQSMGVFGAEVSRVCEIGPGSGRYLEKVLRACHPPHYEIYETAADWSDWLVRKYKVTARRCDGRTLSETASDSTDLVHAHKLFSGIPFLVTCMYWQEMCRVTRAGGWVVFDITTEDCLSGPDLRTWLEAEPWDWEWAPHFMSRSFVQQFFTERNLSLIGSFFVPLWPGRTECFVFRKK